MRLRVKGKNIEVTASIREYAEIEDRQAGEVPHRRPEVEVELSEEKNPSIHEQHVAEATVFMKGSTLRASESAIEMRIAIDRLAREPRTPGPPLPREAARATTPRRAPQHRMSAATSQRAASKAVRA